METDKIVMESSRLSLGLENEVLNICCDCSCGGFDA